MVQQMGSRNSKNSTIEWIFFSEHRLSTIESDAAARNRDRADVRLRRICFAEYNSLDQIGRDQ
jgi:hypothetical protein